MNMFLRAKAVLEQYYWQAYRKIHDYYGQFSPPMDFFIAKYFPKNYVGTSIEVGAADGVSCSNTLHFEHRGWNCLSIEANPVHEASLRHHRQHVLMCAVGEHDQAAAQFNVADMTNGVYEAVSSLELDKRIVDAHQHLLKGIRQIAVQVKTLDQCAHEFLASLPPPPPAIDFITIDTEGTELSVLKGFRLDHWRVPLLVIENNYNDTAIKEYLEPFGYRLDQRYQVNDFYVLKNSKLDTASPA